MESFAVFRRPVGEELGFSASPTALAGAMPLSSGEGFLPPERSSSPPLFDNCIRRKRDVGGGVLAGLRCLADGLSEAVLGSGFWAGNRGWLLGAGLLDGGV